MIARANTDLPKGVKLYVNGFWMACYLEGYCEKYGNTGPTSREYKKGEAVLKLVDGFWIELDAAREGKR